MNEVILLKLGELVLKGLNRSSFEKRFLAVLRRRIKRYGNFSVSTMQSTVYIEPEDGEADMQGAYLAAKKVFGAVSISRAAVCTKDLDAIVKTAGEYLADALLAARTFKVESRRADKRFAYTSPQISREVGGRLHDAFPHLTVDVRAPELLILVEIRERGAYVHRAAEPAAGGMPQGMNGRAALLLSGGIDSPVAGHMIARRGVELNCVHFFSYPYTSERAKRKVIDLARILSGWCGRLTVHVVPFTDIQLAIRATVPEELFTIVMRRFMMRISERVAHDTGCLSLVTGESLGQVASQTMEAISVTEQVCTLPVFRPLIGMDKEEIVTRARAIGTFETSILPYEDCCTIFTPKHPRTRPALRDVLAGEVGLDIDALVESAVTQIERVVVRP